MLTGLSVSGSSTALNPVFRPDVNHYSVVADPAATGISVTATAPDILSISINDALVAGGTAYVVNPIDQGDTVTIVVQNRAGVRQEYTIQYLPSDFPELVVETLQAGVSPGLLYVTLRGPTSNYVAALDNHGVPVFYRAEERAVSDFKRHPNGRRSYALRSGDRTTLDRVISEQVILDENFEEIRRIRTAGLEHTDHHEFLILPNGNTVFLAYEPAIRDLTPFGGASDGAVEDSVIQEIDEAGQVVFQWNSWGRILYADELRSHPTDYAHINSIFVDDDGNFIVSARGTSQVSKIDKASGALLWTLGGKSNEFTFTNDPYGAICGQHTASRLANGNILIFDNGQYCWPEAPDRGETTRVVEFALDLATYTAENVWSYSQEGTYSRSAGSAQRLENGNTLIGWGRGSTKFATEVDADGNKVFEMVATAHGETVRTYRAWRFPD